MAQARTIKTKKEVRKKQQRERERERSREGIQETKQNPAGSCCKCEKYFLSIFFD
jgi:hypothetical protein